MSSIRPNPNAEPLPDNHAIDKSMETAGKKADMMQHVHDELRRRFTEHRIQDKDDAQALLNSITVLTNMARSIETNNTDGKAVMDPNYQDLAFDEVPKAKAAEAAKTFAQSEAARESITINFAISDSNETTPPEFLRGYATQKGEKLAQPQADEMDDLINGMLDEHQLMSVNEEEEGAKITRIYHKKRDDKGNRIPADAETVRQLFQQDLPVYLKEKGINVESIKRQHPKDRAAQKAAQEQAQTSQQTERPQTQTTVTDKQPEPQREVSPSQEQPTQTQAEAPDIEAPSVESTQESTTPGTGGGGGAGG